MSLRSSWMSLTTKIMSKRDKMVGMKSMFSSAFVSSQRPKTLLAAARTEQREFKVVVMPACNCTVNIDHQSQHYTTCVCTWESQEVYLSDMTACYPGGKGATQKAVQPPCQVVARCSGWGKDASTGILQGNCAGTVEPH